MTQSEHGKARELFARHESLLARALAALSERGNWTPFEERPSRKAYGERGREEGRAAFEAWLGGPFPLAQPGESGHIAAERSPYGFSLGTSYPRCDHQALIEAATGAIGSWAGAGVEERAGVLLEALVRLNGRSFELGHATMHTTGQSFVMAFQAGGPHAQDRGLEALATAYRELGAIPETAQWSKRVGPDRELRLAKRYRKLPVGIGLVIGCSTFPTWNSYPGLFASLMTGNAVLVKPHPGAVLPLAITVLVLRAVIEEAGFDPNLVCLVVDTPAEPAAGDLATRDEIRTIDYTGGSEFGQWLERHATHAALFTEKAGVNSIVIDAVDDLTEVADNIAFTLSLYSGQMCTASQNVFVPRSGVRTPDGIVEYERVVEEIVGAVDRLLSDPGRAVDVLGCLQSEGTLDRLERAAAEGGRVIRPSAAFEHPEFPQARVRTPLIVEVDAADEHLFMREMFGPVSYVVRTRDTAQALALATRSARHLGGITASVYATDAETIERAERKLTAAGLAVSFNLTGPIWVNQAAAFSDFHVSGANPAGSGTLCDARFVSPRFRVVQSRRLVTG
jgi:phenylacetic acid degradation protein paaN